MTTTTETPVGMLRCSKDEPALEVRTSRQLELWLDKMAAESGLDHPTVVRLSVHGYELDVGLGLEESFVHIEHESGMPPHFTTLGDPVAEGEVTFYLFGNAHTGIARRNLIPTSQARQIVKEFFENRARSQQVQWEKER